MIKSIDVTNYRNESLHLELVNPYDTGLAITNITGIGPQKASIGSTDFVRTDGMIINSARVASRNIVISFRLLEDPVTGLIETTRQRTYKYFPLKRPLTLTIETDHRRLIIDGIVESNEPDIFQKEETVAINIICPEPWFIGNRDILAIGDSNPLFSFAFSNESLTEPLINLGEIVDMDEVLIYEYNGEVQTGAVFRFKIGEKPDGVTDELTSIAIKNYLTDESMLIDISKTAVGDDPQYAGLRTHLGNHVYVNNKLYFMGTLIREGGGGWEFDLLTSIYSNNKFTTPYSTNPNFSKLTIGTNSICKIGNNIYFVYGRYGSDYRSEGGYKNGDAAYIYGYNTKSNRLTRLYRTSDDTISDHLNYATIFGSLCANSDGTLTYCSSVYCIDTTVHNTTSLYFYTISLTGVSETSVGIIESIRRDEHVDFPSLGNNGDNHYPGMVNYQDELYVFATTSPTYVDDVLRPLCFKMIKEPGYINWSFGDWFDIPDFGSYYYFGARATVLNNYMYIIFALYNYETYNITNAFYRYQPNETTKWVRLESLPYSSSYIYGDMEIYALSNDGVDSIYLTYTSYLEYHSDDTQFYRYKESTGWKKIKSGEYFIEGDEVELSTLDNNRYAKITRSGKEYNILQALPKVTDWIHIDKGQNEIICENGDGSANNRVTVEIQIDNLFEGV